VPVITPRPLESALFGVEIASCDPADAEAVAVAISAARASRCAMLVARTSASATAVVHALERHGGLLCDLLVTATRPVAATAPPTLPEGYVLRPAVATDADAVATVAARAFGDFSGHWHADPRLARDLATELYRRWGRDLVRGMGTALEMHVVTGPDERVLAFLALRHLDDGTTDVPLTAVDPDARGRGVLALMLEGVLPGLAAQGRRAFAYETQVVNAAALRTVTRAGFVPTSARLTFHLWLDDARALPGS
jgi:ribosomal protein S18 acetylase RimI-like enzyme